MRVPAKNPQLSRGAFTLIEMLLVIAIISILMVLSVSSIHNLVNSTDLSTSAVTVVDAFNLARQRALSMNHPVEVRFYKLPPKPGSATSASSLAYRALGIYEISENGPKLIQKLVYLPNSVEFSDSASFGTLLSYTPSASADLNIGGSTLTCGYHYFQYLPDGTTNLDLSGLTERFQTRSQSVRLQPPENESLAAFLARRWGAPITITRQIAERAKGNVRAAMADLEMWIG